MKGLSVLAVAAAAAMGIGSLTLTARADVIQERQVGFRLPMSATYGMRFYLNVLPAHMPVNYTELSDNENVGERLFEQFLLFPTDVGQTFTVSAATDPEFAAAEARLMDGENNAVFWGAIGTTVIDGQPIPARRTGGLSEFEMLYLNEGPRVDLAGYDLSAIHLRVDSTTAGTLIFEGTLVPEPGAALVVLVAGAWGVMRRRTARQ